MNESILPKLRGPFNFLGPKLEEIRLHFPDLERSLPAPVPIFIGSAESSPVYGYPIALSPGLGVLETALRSYLFAEERFQVAKLNTAKVADFSLRDYQQAWALYRELLEKISHNLMTSNFGRRFPELFWLHQSTVIANVLQGTAGRVRKLDLEIGRERGDALRYVVLFEFLEKLFAVLFDLSGKLAAETNQLEDQLFPKMLTRMRDNVLIFTQDHIGKDLSDLNGYFRGYLKIDGKDLLYRYALLKRWHKDEFERDPRLRSAAVGWNSATGTELLEPEEYLFRPHYIEHLTNLPGYDHQRYFSLAEARMWSALTLRLKEFEFLHGARRLITPLRLEGGSYVCEAGATSRLGAAGTTNRIDSETRPYDFTARWIVDPEVSRSGLIYDIRDFSSIVSILRLSERSKQDQAFRQFLYFQHRVETIVRNLHLHSEKYMGDGAFFSGRNVLRTLSAAIKIQRAYKDALGAGLPFDKGMRLALNFAKYHLLPLGMTADSTRSRHEVYGHGLVELSRLVSGKRGFDFAHVQTALLSRGYDDDRVADFFRPLLDAEQESGRSWEKPFRARLEPDGTLINEGIVATAQFIQRLQKSYGASPIRVFKTDGTRFVGIRYGLEKQAGQTPFQVGFRRLGLASFKGLDQIPVFEVIDGRHWDFEEGTMPHATTLLEAVETEFTASLAQSRRE